MSKIVNGRSFPTGEDFSTFGESFQTAMDQVADMMTEMANMLSSTVDGDDLAMDVGVFAGALTVAGAVTASTTLTVTGVQTLTGITTINGGIVMGDAKNIALNAGTGTKIGTATSQKLGFFNKAPVAAQTLGTAVATTVAVSTVSTFGFASAAQANALFALANANRLALANLGLAQ